MVASSLQEYAWNSYGLDLSLEDVEQRIAAYHQLCPELDMHLQDEVDAGGVLAAELQMSPAEYNSAKGRCFSMGEEDELSPQGWLGGMLLRRSEIRPQPLTGPRLYPGRD